MRLSFWREMQSSAPVGHLSRLTRTMCLRYWHNVVVCFIAWTFHAEASDRPIRSHLVEASFQKLLYILRPRAHWREDYWFWVRFSPLWKNLDPLLEHILKLYMAAIMRHSEWIRGGKCVTRLKELHSFAKFKVFLTETITKKLESFPVNWKLLCWFPVESLLRNFRYISVQCQPWIQGSSQCKL